MVEMGNSDEQLKYHHYVLSGVQLDAECFDLWHGVTLSRTFIHLMSHPMLAFSPAEKSKPHPAPWQPAETNPRQTSADLFAKLSVPIDKTDPKGHHNIASWIALLMRFVTDTTITITLSSPSAFEDVREGRARARLLEAVPFVGEGATIHDEEAEWIRHNWHSSLALSRNEALMFAVGSIYHSHRASEALGVVSIWAALERLFSANTAELKYRVCTNIAAFLEPPGEERYELYKHLSKLYDGRSASAHGSPMKTRDVYMDSATIASRSIMRIIELGRIPTRDELERELLAPAERQD
jgi:Apea-like HEPN